MLFRAPRAVAREARRRADHAYRSFQGASEHGERATRPERAGDAAREAVGESEGRSPSD